MSTEEKVKIARSVSSWILQVAGVYGMAAVYLFSQGGPRYLTLELSIAAAFAVAFLAYRTGGALR